ncbi:hypothetical protein ABIB48_003385 [Arthrobacter sp. UYCu511]|uniref:hypothetical protein n=1 Tax=Arthrobacter sp. UYCu511 TaxID=3156337 RepID=UPI00339B2FAC
MTNEQSIGDQQEWPRPGHSFTYTTAFTLDGIEPFEFELSVSAEADEMHISNVIVGRIGGSNAADIELRKELYYVIGRITVASGHIEAAMKRLVLALQENRTRQFSLVDKTWSDLHKILMKESRKNDAFSWKDQVRRNLATHLQWSEERKLKDHRDNFIHGSTWDYAMPVVLLSRFYRKDDGQQILFKMEQIQKISCELEEYARRLETLLHGHWHEAMLPSRAQVPGYSAFIRQNSPIVANEE